MHQTHAATTHQYSTRMLIAATTMAMTGLMAGCSDSSSSRDLAAPQHNTSFFSVPVADLPLAAGPIKELTLSELQAEDGGLALLQPLARLAANENDSLRWQLNMDMFLTNETEQNIWLNSISWQYPQSGAPSQASISGHGLLTEGSNPVKRRHLLQGGWRAFGAHSGSLDERQSSFEAIAVRTNTTPNQFVTAGKVFDGGAQFAVFRLGQTGNALAAATPLELPEGAQSEATALVLSGGATATTFAAGVMILNGQRSIIVARLNTSDLALSTGFGDLLGDMTRRGYRTLTVPNASVRRVAGITMTTGGRPVVLAEVESFGLVRSVMIGLQTNGEIDTNFGQNGYAYLPNNYDGTNTDVTPAAIVSANIGGQLRLFVAASVGDACHHNNIPGTCRVLVRRHNAEGIVEWGYGFFGSALITYPGAVTQGARALVLDSQGSAFVGGWAQVNQNGGSGGLRWAAAKLTPAGGLHPQWGQGGGNLNHICLQDCTRTGRVIHRYSGSAGIITGLALRNDNELVAAGWARNNAKSMQDMAIGVYTPLGEANWGNWALTLIPTFDGWGLASGVAVETTGQVVAIGSSNHNMDTGATGTWQASARYLADGTLNSRLNFAPGDTRELKFPESRLSAVALNQIGITLNFRGGQGQAISLPIKVHNPQGLPTGYLFPLSGLDNDEYFYITQQHLLSNNHRQSNSQKFAYDFAVQERNPDTGNVFFTAINPATGNRFNGTENHHSLVWGKPVRAAADGTILSCFSLFPDNERPGEQHDWVRNIAGGGNMFWIQHTSGELALYAHLRAGSVPEALCPTPSSNDPADQGVNNLGITVTRGQQLGVVGNSGSSSGPHLHFHVQVNGGDIDGTNPGSGLPLLFSSSTEIIGISEFTGGKSFAPALRQSLPPGILINVTE